MKQHSLPILLFVLFIALLTLTACGSPTPVPTVQAIVVAPATATPVPPTDTPVPPTETPVPPTLTATPTATLRPTDTPTPTMTPDVIITSTLESGWIQYEMRTPGFAVALPPKWQRLDLSSRGLENSFEMAAVENPELAKYLSSPSVRSLAASGVKFYAVDLGRKLAPGDFPVSANILKMDIGIELPLDLLAPMMSAELGKLADPAYEITNRRVTLSNVEAEEFKYSMKTETGTGEPVSLAVMQYIIPDGTSEYVITLMCTRKLSGQYIPVFEKIGKSFRLLNRSGEADVTATTAATRPPAPTRTKPPAPTATAAGPKYGAPILLNPGNGFGYSCKESLFLEWSGPASLAEDEWYVVESAKTDHPDKWCGISEWQKQVTLQLDPARVKGGCNAMWWCPLGGGSEGAYYWRVRIVQGDKATHTIKADVSPLSEARIINYHQASKNVLEVNLSCP